MSSTYIPAKLRQLVYERAKGCCEYCLIPEIAVLLSHQIGHIIAEKHSGLTQADNLALSCAICNKYKGSDIASIDLDTNELAGLFHPRLSVWSTHFQLNNAHIIPLTANARVTVKLLQLNRSERIAERQLLIAANLLSV
ncbi:MAG: HNH endonuclease [Methylococcaceae bacterium]|nr:HNH endonuclease [Methylococcaceae bacterium]